MGKGSSGGGTNTTNTVTDSAPPPQVMAQYQGVINQANQVAATPYTTGGFNANNMVAGFSPMQNSSFNTINQAQGLQAPYVNQAQNYLNSSQTPIWNGAQQYSPSTMAQYANPYMNQAVGATEAQINNTNQQQQQQVIGNAVSSGAWGGDRSAIAQSELANQQDLASGQTIANMENTGFNQQQGEFNTQQAAQIGANEANAWLGTQGSALESNLGTTALNDTLQGASTQLQAGALQQQLQQEQENVPYEQFQAQQAYPFQTGSWLSDISEGIGGSEGGVGSGSTTTPAPSTLSQLAGLGIGGYSLYQGMNMGSMNPASTGASLGESRGGRIIKRAPGGAIPNFDMGGGAGGATPGFMPAGAFMNGVPDASASYVGSPPAMGHGAMGPPMVKAPTGSTGSATTTGIAEPGGLSPTTMNAGMRLAGQAMKPGTPSHGLSPASVSPSGNYAGPAALDDWNASKAGLGDTTVNFTTPGGAANLTPYVNAAGDSVQPGVSGMDSAVSDAGANIGASAGLNGGIGSGTALADAGTAATTDAVAGAAADAGTAAAAGAGATAAGAAASAADLAPLLLLAKGGAIHRARGGFTSPHYDDGGGVGGITPAQAGSNPLEGNLYSQYANMSTEQLQQLNARSGGKNPTIMAALQKKQMTGGTAPAPQQAPMVQGVSPQPGMAPAQPQGILQQQGMSRGGLTPRHYDAGGSDDADYLTQITGGDSTAPSAGLSPSMPVPSAANAPNALPDHDTFMKNYGNEVANAQPYNQVNPWMALAQAGFGMAASRNPHALGAAGEGAVEGMQNLTGQQKEAAQESERRGTLQEQGEQLYNNMVQHKEQMSQEGDKLQQQKEYQSGLLANDAAKTKIQQQIADQGKITSDPFGQRYYTGGPKAGQNVPLESSSGASGAITPDIANVWKPPVGADGKPLSGDDYYATVPPMVAKEGKLMQDGQKASPSSFGSRDPVLRAGEAAASNADPTFTGTRYSTIQDFEKSSTPAAATARSQNAIAEHLPVLQSAITALDNGNERPINALANQIAKQNGEPAPTNTEMAMTIVADEAAKAIIGSKATQGDREEFVKNLTTSAGRDQLQGQLTTARKLIAGQMHAGEQAYNTGTGLDPARTPASTYDKLNYRDKFMSESPNARKLMETYYPTPLPPVEKRVAGKTYWGPGGKQMTWTKDDKGNQGWSAPQGAQ